MIRPLTCVILAGGLGRRLRKAVKDVPKPMALVNGRPFLEYLLAAIRTSGVRRVILCVGYKAGVIEEYFRDGRAFGLCVRYSREKTLRGTAGALRQARRLIRSDPFIVMNGDSFCKVDLSRVYAEHRCRKAAVTLVAARVRDCSRFGRIFCDAAHRVTGFHEKVSSSGAGYVNAGIYVLNKNILDRIPAKGVSSLENDILPALAGGIFLYSRQRVS